MYAVCNALCNVDCYLLVTKLDMTVEVEHGRCQNTSEEWKLIKLNCEITMGRCGSKSANGHCCTTSSV